MFGHASLHNFLQGGLRNNFFLDTVLLLYRQEIELGINALSKFSKSVQVRPKLNYILRMKLRSWTCEFTYFEGIWAKVIKNLFYWLFRLKEVSVLRSITIRFYDVDAVDSFKKKNPNNQTDFKVPRSQRKYGLPTLEFVLSVKFTSWQWLH